MTRIDSSVASIAVTLFLFTKSDIKTTVIPVGFFAMAAAPMTNISRLPHVLFWIWLNILHFNISNQTLDPKEDAINKKYRPIPSGRITLSNAILLRWALLPLVLVHSALYSVETVYASIALAIITFIYDEMHAHAGHWLVRHALNVVGYASFHVGASLVAGSPLHTLDANGVLAVLISAGITATTIHAQDFKDVHGDRAIGRRTVPISFPAFARWTVLIPLIVWSIVLSILWQLDVVVSCAFTTLAIFIGGRYLLLRNVSEDQVSYYWYNVWLSIANALPGYYRIRHMEISLPNL
ncbi:UbiA prenyltransferase family [Vararia minispora EC-137]|uniref:UbiA prenyltransferase family n=1 Tax=Vararia minispora EC-137 TaxID=1314806 RepID=A0ACB8QNK5_9AGAM|nr:UbiA prenyltransferase family [Vararia minispora EC-137]